MHTCIFGPVIKNTRCKNTLLLKYEYSFLIPVYTINTALLGVHIHSHTQPLIQEVSVCKLHKMIG